MSTAEPRPSLTVVSGLSGSGKSVALRTLEDFDYYCVDNLPAELLPSFVQSFAGDASEGSDPSAPEAPAGRCPSQIRLGQNPRTEPLPPNRESR